MAVEIPEVIAKAYEVNEKPKEEGKAPEVALEEVPVPQAQPTPVVVQKKAAKKKEKAVVKGLVIQNRRPSVDPFLEGERLAYDVTWMKTTAGEMVMEVLPMRFIEGRKVYHFRGTARTTSLVAAIYRAEDYIESFVDYEGLFPYKFVLHGDESKHLRDSHEMYDHAKGKQYVYVRDDRLNGDVREEKGIKELVPFSQDSLSAIYYMRTLKLEKGQSLPVSVATFGHMSDMVATNVGPETVKTKAGTFETTKYRIQVNFKREKKHDDNYFWITNDSRRFIIKYEMKVKIGWMGGSLKSLEPGHPFSP